MRTRHLPFPIGNTKEIMAVVYDHGGCV
ncbi:MAG: hypothetical protein AAGD07_17760 [Planctomycetota bacterium]